MANGVWRRLCEFKVRRSGAPAQTRAADTADTAEAAAAHTPPTGRAVAAYGAGWYYASTSELHSGLDVLEGLPADARPEEALIAYFLAQGVGP